MEDRKTDSFNRFLDDNLLKKLTPKNTRKIDLDESDAEWEVLDLICKYYINRTNNFLGNWQTFKVQHKKSIISSTNPNFSYIVYKNKLSALDKKLNTRAKLHYLQELINEFGFGFVEACLSYVIFIKTVYHKTDYSNFKLSKMYNYLNYALLETTFKELDYLFNLPINKLVDLLYNNVIKTLFLRDTLDYSVYLNLDQHVDIKISDLKLIEDNELFNLAEKAFQEHLRTDMHTLDNGNIF